MVNQAMPKEVQCLFCGIFGEANVTPRLTAFSFPFVIATMQT